MSNCTQDAPANVMPYNPFSEENLNFGQAPEKPTKPEEDATYTPAPVPAPLHTPVLGSSLSDTATRGQIENAFTYHAPKPGQPERYTKLRDVAKAFATLISEACPLSRERALALTKVGEAVVWANAAIARNE